MDTRIHRACHGTGKTPIGLCSCNNGQVEVKPLPFKPPTNPSPGLDSVLRAYRLSSDMFFVGIATALDYPLEAPRMLSTGLGGALEGSGAQDFLTGLRMQLWDPESSMTHALSLATARQDMKPTQKGGIE